ncbi:MAG: glutaredoxin family protein [Verrucomicrobiales bacterium]|jgi:glutaredoxin 3|nr:glutaredoxin family protein [Verrucomicrobiales bacterium]MBP9224896.1 glutaredoxin family protein [Verrucomicrobiales bacterium]HQZ27885.1 glutaredoxin family protein [Verrucomicrobiales bacterium]
MSEEPILKVYIKPGCPWCVDAIAYLKKDGFQFEEIDVYADPAMYQEMKDLSGQSSAPTLTYGELLLADFGVDEMQAFFNQHNIAP